MSQLCFFTFLSLFSLFGFESEESDAISPSFVVLSQNRTHLRTNCGAFRAFFQKLLAVFFWEKNATPTFGVNIFFSFRSELQLFLMS